MSKSTNTVVYFDWKTIIYIYVCGKCRSQFMLPMEKSVTCANKIIPSINRSFVFKANAGRHVGISYLCLFACSGVQHILCCVFVLIIFVSCVSAMSSVSLNCPFLIATLVFSSIYFLSLASLLLKDMPIKLLLLQSFWVALKWTLSYAFALTHVILCYQYATVWIVNLPLMFATLSLGI